MCALAPVTYMENQESQLLSEIATLQIDTLLGTGEFDPTPGLLNEVSSFFPWSGSAAWFSLTHSLCVLQLLGAVCIIHPSWCNGLLTPLAGPSTNLNQSSMQVYLSHWP